MATFSLNKDAGGWCHFAGRKPVYCATFLDALIGGEWVRGRYEVIDLHRGASKAKAYLVLANYTEIDLDEGTEVRFLEKESLPPTSP